VIAGLNFAVAHGAKIVNMSFGGSSFDAAFQGEIINARNNGVIVVAAAGNDGTNNDNAATPQYPCNFSQDNVICVAALEQAYGITTFSNFGPINVDVGAPGANVLSAWPGPTITDNFSTGWTFPNGGWVHVVCSFGTAPIDLLVDPSGFCSPPPFPTYAANANHLAYKAFNLAGVSHASAGFFRFLDTEPGNDFLGFAHSTTAGDPFTTNAGSITEESGTSNSLAEERTLRLDDCLTASCTFGFRLRSNSTTTAGEFGVGILFFTIDTTQTGSNVYEVLNGTSMATPHVSGVAAMVWAYNPNFTYADVVNSVKFGGDSIPALQGITTTGRAVDAAGSLRFINTPTGVSAVF
jgi:thermitase